MNKGYVLDQEQAVIITDLGMKEPVEFTTNFDEILVKQNYIEDATKKLDDTEKELEKIHSNRKYRIGLSIVQFAASLCFITLLIIPFFQSGLLSDPTMMLKFKEFMFKFGLPVIFGAGSFISLIAYSDYKDYKNDVNVTEETITYLKNEIDKENEALKRLENSKVKTRATNINGLVTKNVNDKEVLNALRMNLLLLKLSTKIERLIELEKNGELSLSIKGKCKKEEMDFIKEEVAKAQLAKTRK